MDYWSPQEWLQRRNGRITSVSLLDDVNMALPTIPVTKTNKVLYVTLIVILEVLG